MVRRHPIHPRDHVRGEADSGAAQHPHTVQRDALRHPVGHPTDGARDVGAVAVTILADHDEIERESVVHVVGPAAEVGVERPDACVDDVGVHAGAIRRIGVRAGEGERLLIDPVEPPGVAVRVHRLGPVRPDCLIGLNVGHERLQPQQWHCSIRQGRGEALERGRVRVQQRAVVRGDEGLRQADRVRNPVGEHDDVASGARLREAGQPDGCGRPAGLERGRGVLTCGEKQGRSEESGAAELVHDTDLP